MVSSSAQPIHTNPLIKLFRQQFKLMLITVILFFVLMLAFLLIVCIHVHFEQVKVAQLIRNELSPLFPVLVVVLIIVLSFRQWRYWQQLEPLRVAAAAGDPALQAAEQPNADAAALPLPYKMTLSYNMSSRWRLSGIALIFFIVYMVFAVWMNNNFLDLITEYPAVTIVVAMVGIGLLLVILISGMRRQKRTIEVSQSGITMYGAGEPGYVSWHDARLFAVYRSFNARDDQYSLTYELSSPIDIVRWTAVIHHPALTLLRMTPDIPLREYQQQIQALNALVVARTGLPLCDLRKNLP